MLTNNFKLFKSDTTNSYLLILEIITTGYLNVLFSINKNNRLQVNGISQETFDKEPLTEALTKLSPVFVKENIFYDPVAYQDYDIRLNDFKSKEYTDMTNSITSTVYKSFKRMHCTHYDNNNIVQHLIKLGINVYTFAEDDTQNLEIPKEEYIYKPDLTQAYIQSGLDINQFKFRMPRQTDYEVISKSALFIKIMRMINSERPFSNKRNFLLLGPASGGKTEVVNTIAQHMDLPYASVNCLNKMDIDSFFVVLHPGTDSNGALKWYEKHTDLLDVIINGGIVLLDEFNNLDHQTQLLWNNIIEGSRKTIFVHGKTYKVSEDIIFFATGNVAYQGTKSLNTATKSRFEQLHVPTLTSEDYLKKINKIPAMSKHVSNGNTKKYVDFLFKTKAHLDSFLSENTSIVEPPMIVSRQMDIFFDKLFVTNDFVEAFKEWVSGMFHSTSLTTEDTNTFIKHLESDAVNCNINFKSAYFEEQPIEINGQADKIINNDLKTDILSKINSIKNKI